MGISNPSIEFVSIIRKQRLTFFERLIALLSGKVTMPTSYGWYHFLCLAVTIGLCVLVVLKAKNISDKKFNLIIGATACALLILEVYKQLIYSYDGSTDSWSYEWYAFPFQFCSTPMYVLLLASLLKNGKVKDALCSFSATYGFFAGAAVMFYPGDVFSSFLGINVQTMVHHGAMVVMGVFMYVTGRAKLSHKTVLRALPVFLSLVVLALTANVLYEFFGDPEQTFNMFFISPYYPCTLPVLSLFYGKVPYLIFLAIYVFGFTAAGYVMSLLAMGVNKLRVKIYHAIEAEEESI